MSFTYTQLKTAIEDYTENNETSFITNLPVFIRLTDGNSETVFIDFKDSEFVQSYNPNPATTGSPKYYGQYDLDNFILAPTPSSSFNSELHYFYRPLSLTQSSFTLTLTSVTGTFTASDTITGGTSGESSEVDSVPSSTSLIVVIPSGSYTVGETITASPSGATATISAIGADTTVTWLSENAEMAMLYGSLSEAYLYMKGDPQKIKKSRRGSRTNRSISFWSNYPN